MTLFAARHLLNLPIPRWNVTWAPTCAGVTLVIVVGIPPKQSARNPDTHAPLLPLVGPAPGLYIGSSGETQEGPMLELLGFISYLITLYVYIIIAGAIMSWLIAFNVINPYNQFVRALWQALNAVTEPALRPIRRVLPDLGGIDISPLVLILILFFIQSVILPNIAKLFV
jgi:YggT family protein